MSAPSLHFVLIVTPATQGQPWQARLLSAHDAVERQFSSPFELTRYLSQLPPLASTATRRPPPAGGLR